MRDDDMNMRMRESRPDLGARWRLCLMALLSVLCSCSGSGDKKPTYADLKWSQRVNQQLKNPHAIHSPFQSKVYDAARGVKTESFKTSSFHGGKAFSAADDSFKAGGFSQAGKTSPAGAQIFAGADQESRIGGGTYRTGQSHLDGKVSSSNDRTSPMSGDVFKTGPDREGAKASANARRPLIQDPVEPAYSETEVRSFLNKLR